MGTVSNTDAGQSAQFIIIVDRGYAKHKINNVFPATAQLSNHTVYKQHEFPGDGEQSCILETHDVNGKSWTVRLGPVGELRGMAWAGHKVMIGVWARKECRVLEVRADWDGRSDRMVAYALVEVLLRPEEAWAFFVKVGWYVVLQCSVCLC